MEGFQNVNGIRKPAAGEVILVDITLAELTTFLILHHPLRFEMSEQKIADMLKKVNKRKTELAELRGEKTQIQKQMKDEGCETLEDLEREIAKEDRKIEKLDTEIEKAVVDLESNYDWS